MRKVKVAATQMSCSWNGEEVLDKAEKLVRKAAAEGANIILLQELFETPYFCQKQKFEYFDLAKPLSENAAVKRFTEVAKELQVVLPISFYEKAGNTAFNTIAIIDADGTILGTYRKTHIPDGLPYAEKFYFTREIPDLRYGRQNMQISALASAGINGSRRLPEAWHFLVQSCCSIRLQSEASLH